MHKVKIMAVGNSAGIILPKEVLARLGVQKGDAVQLDFDGEGMFLSKADDTYNESLAAGRECFGRYAMTLKELGE
nr:AbrB/MazE/SpoVT family DNA-binding domain-containing protein [Polymorphobacter sp.]